MKKFERYTTECEAAYIRDNSYELLCEHFKYVGIHGVDRSGSIELSFEVGPSEDRTVFIKTENWLVKHPNGSYTVLGDEEFRKLYRHVESKEMTLAVDVFGIEEFVELLNEVNSRPKNFFEKSTA